MNFVKRTVTEIKCCTRVFGLTKPVEVTVVLEDAVWTATLEGFDMVGMGKSEHEALDDLWRDFHGVWDGIVRTEDSKLTQDAIDLKKRLCDMVEYEVLS